MSDLLALADRVEALAGADREVDILIVKALCPDATVGEYCGYEDVVFHAKAIGIPNKEICPFYTASIDAAMTLAPEFWVYFDFLRFDDGTVECSLEAMGTRTGETAGAGRSPAIALAAAALRARAGVQS